MLIIEKKLINWKKVRLNKVQLHYDATYLEKKMICCHRCRFLNINEYALLHATEFPVRE